MPLVKSPPGNTQLGGVWTLWPRGSPFLRQMFVASHIVGKHCALCACRPKLAVEPDLRSRHVDPVRQGSDDEPGSIPEKLKAILKRCIQDLDCRKRKLRV